LRFVRSDGRFAILSFVTRGGRRQPLTGAADLEPLQSGLARLDSDIRRRRVALTRTQERLAADAAFLMEGIENHEISWDDPKLAVLERSISRTATRDGLLGRELRFIEATRRSLAAFLDEQS
jgi:hypothetical protein